MSADRGVLVELTDEQVANVVREAAARVRPAELLPEIGDVDQLGDVVVSLLDDAAYSRSVLRALLVLDAHPVDGSERTLTGVATQLGFSPSTTHPRRSARITTTPARDPPHPARAAAKRPPVAPRPRILHQHPDSHPGVDIAVGAGACSWASLGAAGSSRAGPQRGGRGCGGC